MRQTFLINLLLCRNLSLIQHSVHSDRLTKFGFVWTIQFITRISRTVYSSIAPQFRSNTRPILAPEFTDKATSFVWDCYSSHNIKGLHTQHLQDIGLFVKSRHLRQLASSDVSLQSTTPSQICER